MNQPFDLSKLIPEDAVSHSVESRVMMTRFEVPISNGESNQVMMPVFDMKFTRGNGTTVTVALPPDLVTPLCHALLGFVTSLGASPPGPPNTDGTPQPPLSLPGDIQ
jgi:hypothetical protein